MSLGKVARKLKRVGKTAYQFRITSTFEYIELGCNGTWRPENLRVIWIRSHRRVQSIDVKWLSTEDRGPNGALGRGTFDPSFSVALIVTVYGDPNKSGQFEEKEYKYYIESDGPTGKKIVASFNIDISEYTSLNGSKHTLDMAFKPVSKKINKAVLGITLQSEFIKQGSAIDDDMQSTFSAVSAGQDSLQFDEEELETVPTDTTDVGTERGLPQPSGDTELVTLGTGERMKRTTLPQMAPKKPIRQSPLLERKVADVETEQNDKTETVEEEQVEVKVEVEPEPNSRYMNLNAEVEVEPEPNSRYMNLNAEGEVDTTKVEEPSREEEEEEERGPPRETVVDRRTSRQQKREREKLVKDREKQEERERKERERKEEKERKLREKSKSKSPPPVDSPILHPREKVKASPSEDAKLTNGVDKERDKSTQGASEVVMTKPPNKITACGELIDTMFDTTNAGEGELTAVCKGTKVVAVETNVVEESPGKYQIQFIPEMADMYMLSVRWRGSDITGSPFLINLNLLAPAQKSEEENKENGNNDVHVKEQLTEPSKENGNREGEGEGERDRKGEREVREAVKEKDKNLKQNVTENGVSQEQAEHTTRDVREKSPQIVVSVSDDPFDMAYEARRLLEEQQKAAQSNHSEDTESKSGRKVVKSKEEWIPRVNHVYEDIPEEAQPPPVSPLEAWLADAQFCDCFGESVSREKLEKADIIGLYFSASWCPPCRRFLPKLVKFYHHLKQSQKNFEVLYISSDYSKQEMCKYMQEQQMPWMSLAFDSTLAEKLRVDYNVSAIPILTIVNKEGVKLEERGRKPVEQATSSSAILKLYNKWVEKSQQEVASPREETTATEKKGGILKNLKSAIHKPSKEHTAEPGGAAHGDISDPESGGGTRVTVEPRSSKHKAKEQSAAGGVSLQVMEEKEEKIRHLEEVNMSLRQTNDDLNEEVAELKRQIGEFQAKLTMLEESSKQLEDEKRELMANLQIRGWLLKRGIKGPTANLWRRRYFRCDQGSKIYYYKSSSEGTPQGYIDLDLVVSVQEISPAQQDKNHATFLVQCEGRTFQLQAHDETTMRKWMSAIEYLKNWRQRNSPSDVN